MKDKNWKIICEYLCPSVDHLIALFGSGLTRLGNTKNHQQRYYCNYAKLPPCSSGEFTQKLLLSQTRQNVKNQEQEQTHAQSAGSPIIQGPGNLSQDQGNDRRKQPRFWDGFRILPQERQGNHATDQ